MAKTIVSCRRKQLVFLWDMQNFAQYPYIYHIEQKARGNWFLHIFGLLHNIPSTFLPGCIWALLFDQCLLHHRHYHFISTEGALRRPLTYDNHPSIHPIPSPLFALHRPERHKMTLEELRSHNNTARVVVLSSDLLGWVEVGTSSDAGSYLFSPCYSYNLKKLKLNRVFMC